MVDSSDIDNFPVFLIQDVINVGNLYFGERFRLYGSRYQSVLNELVYQQGSTVLDCYDKIFAVPENQMVEMDDDAFERLFGSM